MLDPTPRIVKILDAVSQLGNVANPLWDHTDTTANESISGRAYRSGWWIERPIDAVFRFLGYPDHCRASHTKDVERAYKTIEQGSMVHTARREDTSVDPDHC